MKLSDYRNVNMLISKRNELIRDLNVAADESLKGLGVTISGKYQKDEIVNAARSKVCEKITESIYKIDEELRSLGIVVDTPTGV